MIIHREIRSSYHHKPKVQGFTTPPSSWRRWRSRRRRWRPRQQRPAGVFPLQSAALGLCFVVSLFCPCSLLKAVGGLFLYSVLGQDEGSGEKIDGNGATRLQKVGPMWPRNLAVWATPFWASGLCLFASFAPSLLSS